MTLASLNKLLDLGRSSRLICRLIVG